MAVITIVPVVWIWMSAFKTHLEIYLGPFSLPETFNYMNIVKAWTIGRFSIYFKNSIIMTLASTLIVVFLSSLAGFALGMFNFYGSRLLFYFMLTGLLLPPQAFIIPLYFKLKALRLLNTYWAYILPSSGINVCFGTFMMRAFFKSLPRELLDSAFVDGCSKFKAFRYVMLPMAKPAMTALFIFQSVWNWIAFFLPFIVIQKDSLRPVTVGLMFFRGRYSMDYGLVCAGVAVASLPLIITYLAIHKRFVSGISQGALKG